MLEDGEEAAAAAQPRQQGRRRVINDVDEADVSAPTPIQQAIRTSTVDSAVPAPPVADAGGAAAAGPAGAGGSSRRRPGRPPRTPAVQPNDIDPATGDCTDSLFNSTKGLPVDISLTVTSRNAGSIPTYVMSKIVDYMKDWCIWGVCSLERGQEKGNLHLQVVAAFGVMRTFETPAKLQAALWKNIRDYAGIATADRIKLILKQLEGAQTFDGEGAVALVAHLPFCLVRWLTL